ncbi:hypothetical protein Tco_0072995 [Tanacetum coccineum]
MLFSALFLTLAFYPEQTLYCLLRIYESTLSLLHPALPVAGLFSRFSSWFHSRAPCIVHGRVIANTQESSLALSTLVFHVSLYTPRVSFLFCCRVPKITTKRPPISFDAYVCSFNLFSFKSGLKLLLSATSVGSDRALSSPTILGVSSLLSLLIFMQKLNHLLVICNLTRDANVYWCLRGFQWSELTQIYRICHMRIHRVYSEKYKSEHHVPSDCRLGLDEVVDFDTVHEHDIPLVLDNPIVSLTSKFAVTAFNEAD